MVTILLKVTLDRVGISEILLVVIPVNHSIFSNKKHMTMKEHWQNFGIGMPVNQIYF